MAKSKELAESRIPVFIGVTGHRALRSEGNDLTRLKEAVKNAIREICGNCKYTDFILLTSLAAGADQLAAEAVIEMANDPKTRKNSIRFAAVLPMEQEKYFTRVSNGEHDFTPEQRRNAEMLMKSEHCAFVYELPEQHKGQADGDITPDDLQFRETARFISDNCFAGIALWDGELDPAFQAGTGTTVRDFLHGKAYHLDSFPHITIPETRPIYHIYTPRPGTAARKNLDYKMRRLFPEPLLETGEKWFTLNSMSDDDILRSFNSKAWHKVGAEREKRIKSHLEAIERYNKDVTVNSEYIAENGYPLNISKSDWNEISAFSKNEDESGMLLRSESRAELCEKYHIAADALSQKYQSKRKRNIWWIVWIAGFAYIALNIFSDLVQKPQLLLLYLVLLVVAVLIHRREEKKNYHTRFVDYRTLAEGLRVQYFWYAADVSDRHAETALAQNYYLRRQKGQIEWIRHAIRSINLLATTCCKNEHTAGLEDVKKVSEVWLGRMDVKDEASGIWYNPTFGLKQNGQVGYFLDTSLKSKKGINLQTRPSLSEEASDEDKKKFRKKIKKEALRLSAKYRTFRLLNWLTKICIGISMALAVILVICLLAIPENTFVQQCTDPMMFIAGLLPVVAMVLREISVQMGYEEDVDRYAWYYNAFKRAVIEIDEVCKDTCRSDSDKTDVIKEILFEIGEESLIENADWVMLNAKRVPEVPSN